VLPERSGYYLGHRLVERFVTERGLAPAMRAAAEEFQTEEERSMGQTA
jgi:uncharacterized protein YjaZ